MDPPKGAFWAPESYLSYFEAWKLREILFLGPLEKGGFHPILETKVLFFQFHFGEAKGAEKNQRWFSFKEGWGDITLPETNSPGK